MKFTTDLTFIGGKVIKSRKKNKTYRVALFLAKNGNDWDADWQEVFISDQLYHKLKGVSSGDKVRCVFSLVKDRMILLDIDSSFRGLPYDN